MADEMRALRAENEDLRAQLRGERRGGGKDGRSPRSPPRADWNASARDPRAYRDAKGGGKAKESSRSRSPRSKSPDRHRWSEETIKKEFDRFDTNKSGKIDVRALHLTLTLALTLTLTPDPHPQPSPYPYLHP